MADRSVRIVDEAVFEVLDDETVILNLDSGEYHVLNRTGTRAWQLIEQHGDLGAVAAAMAEEFGVPPERVEPDLARLVKDLLERGLVAYQ